MTIEGEWAGRVTGVHGQRVEAAMGYRRVMFILIGLAQQLRQQTSRENPMEGTR